MEKVTDVTDAGCNPEVSPQSTSTAQNPSPTKEDDPGQGGMEIEGILQTQELEEPAAEQDAEDYLDCYRVPVPSEVVLALNDVPYDDIFSPDSFISTVLTDINEAGSDPEMAHSFSSTAAAASLAVTSEDQFQGGIQGQRLSKKRKLHQQPEGYDPQGDILPSDAAFSIDHILEQILNPLPGPSLLKCRLVCRRWLSVATIALQQNSPTITFDYGVLKGRNRPWLRGREFSAFVELLEENLETHPWEFPCNKFNFEGQNLTGDVFVKFLNVHGVNVQELTFSQTHLPNATKTVDVFRKLLTEQTPNLEHLFLDSQIVQGSRDPFVVELPTSPNARENTALKTLIVSPGLPLELLKFIMSICPNLEEVDTNHYSAYLTPVVRLNLLKTFRMSECGFGMPEEIVRASLEHPGTLKLKKIVLDRIYVLLPNISFVFNHLFESSWDTLKSISWYNVEFRQGMLWPEQMPNVTTIRLSGIGIYSYRNTGYHAFCSNLPRGFNLGRILPQLQTVHLFHGSIGTNNLVDFLKELNREAVPVLTVTDVHVYHDLHRNITPGAPLEIPAEMFRLIETMFPNARYWGRQNCPLRMES